MQNGSTLEKTTRPADREKSKTLYESICAALRESREGTDNVSQALARVRALMHNEFRDVTIIRSFVIEDPVSFDEWRIAVRYPDGREVVLTHE